MRYRSTHDLPRARLTADVRSDKRLGRRQRRDYTGAQVIALSGENDAYQVKEIVTLGVVDFLLKPVSDPRTRVRLLGALARLKSPPRKNTAGTGVGSAPSDKVASTMDSGASG